MSFHLYYEAEGYTEEEVINAGAGTDEQNVTNLATTYPDAIYYEVLPEAKAIEVKVSVCSACGSSAEHHVAYVREHGVCVC